MVVPTIGPSRARESPQIHSGVRSPICARPSFQRKGKAALASTSALRKRRSRAIPSAALQSSTTSPGATGWPVVTARGDVWAAGRAPQLEAASHRCARSEQVRHQGRRSRQGLPARVARY